MNNSNSPSKNFHLTAVTWKGVIGKIDFEAIEECLNEELTLADYGEAVKSMYGSFLAIQLNNPIHDEYVEYDDEEQILEVAVKLDMRLLKDASKESTLQMMAKAFLDYINEYPVIEGFDQNRFYMDVQSTFVNKGWIQNTTPILSLSEKVEITGLEEAIVRLIETDIDKAALGWIKIYCGKLKLEYRDLMPEFFSE
ncbi:MAG: hypothetical protein ACPG49_02560 [Chitinophagales bacterium]